MNILYSFRTRGVGAESVHISGIANAFEDLGHEVDFVSPTKTDPRNQAGTNPYEKKQKTSLIHRFANQLPGVLFELAEVAYNWHAKAQISKSLNQKKYGLIYERHAFFLNATSKIAQQAGIPYIVEVNELVGDERVRKQPLFTPLAKQCDRLTFERATRIIVVSPHLKRKIQEEHGINERKILVHPNAVEAALLAKTPDPAIFVDRFNLNGKLNIGFVGWFVEWHRLDLMLVAISDLIKSSPNLHPNLVLIGDGPLKETLQAQAKSLNIESNITFTGPIDHSMIPAIIRALDIAVIPHSNEFRSPIKLFEYMAQERPVIAPSSEPIRSVVSHGENALLFPPLDQSSLSQNLQRLANDSVLQRRLGQNARKTVEQRHTWKHNAEHILEEIQNSR